MGYGAGEGEGEGSDMACQMGGDLGRPGRGGRAGRTGRGIHGPLENEKAPQGEPYGA